MVAANMESMKPCRYLLLTFESIEISIWIWRNHLCCSRYCAVSSLSIASPSETHQNVKWTCKFFKLVDEGEIRFAKLNFLVKIWAVFFSPWLRQLRLLWKVIPSSCWLSPYNSFPLVGLLSFKATRKVLNKFAWTTASHFWGQMIKWVTLMCQNGLNCTSRKLQERAPGAMTCRGGCKDVSQSWAVRKHLNGLILRKLLLSALRNFRLDQFNMSN